MPSITFAGVGGAFAKQDQWQSNMLIEADGQKMIVDCGGDARFSFGEIGVQPADLNAVYISHLHADHMAGLDWLGFCTYFNPACERPILYIAEPILNDLWKSIEAGMKWVNDKMLTLDSFFDVRPIQVGKSFEFGGMTFTPIPTCHIGSPPEAMYSYGLFIENGKRTTFLTTDTQFRPDSMRYDADRIFHDCETYARHSGVHPRYEDLSTLDPEIKKKMWLYHYFPDHSYDCVADGFAGFVQKGQKFDL